MYSESVKEITDNRVLISSDDKTSSSDGKITYNFDTTKYDRFSAVGYLSSDSGGNRFCFDFINVANGDTDVPLVAAAQLRFVLVNISSAGIILTFKNINDTAITVAHVKKLFGYKI